MCGDKEVQAGGLEMARLMSCNRGNFRKDSSAASGILNLFPAILSKQLSSNLAITTVNIISKYSRSEANPLAF